MYTAKGMIGHILMKIMRILPLQNKIIFCSFNGNVYGDNPRSIYEEFVRRNLPIKYIWFLNDINIKVKGAEVMPLVSLKALYHLSTAKVWIDCSGMREWVIKRK